MIFIAFVLVIFALIALAAWQQQQFGLREKGWDEERGRLLNRIQVPEAAPFLNEQIEDSGENDMPVLPEFTMDAEELRKAKEELEAAGYSEGPVA